MSPGRERDRSDHAGYYEARRLVDCSPTGDVAATGASRSAAVSGETSVALKPDSHRLGERSRAAPEGRTGYTTSNTQAQVTTATASLRKRIACPFSPPPVARYAARAGRLGATPEGRRAARSRLPHAGCAAFHGRTR